MTWLQSYSASAALTDRLADMPDHPSYLALGMMGEAGGVLAELKKLVRESDAYPTYKEKISEELADFLWYLVRLTTIIDPAAIDEIPTQTIYGKASEQALDVFLNFGGVVGELLACVRSNRSDSVNRLRDVWDVYLRVCQSQRIDIAELSMANLRKISSRWPNKLAYLPLFDDAFLDEEQLPRYLSIDFIERDRGTQKEVLLRCNGLTFGDRITDNIGDPDGYRYHDIFHFAYAVHLGWSPVIRHLLRCKRKSKPEIDETEDGARARILEEAVSAVAFRRAKELNFFTTIKHVDYDLLKTIQAFVEGYEVERVPLWQWEKAILCGFELFRSLLANRGGTILLDLPNRSLLHKAEN